MAMEKMLFDLSDVDPFEKFQEDLQVRCDAIVAEKGFPAHCLAVVQKVGKTVTSFAVVVSEPSAPFGKVDPSAAATGAGVLYMKRPTSKVDAGKIEIRLDGMQDHYAPTPMTAEKVLKEPSKAPKYFEVKMRLDDPALLPYLEKILSRELDVFVTKEPVFGCCDRYVECSDAKKCLHKNPMYATACAYRKNLEAGRIFYGKNKTV